MGWSAYGGHPNSRGAVRYRHKQLRKAATVLSGTRIGTVKRLARGKKVLDVGCVSHSFKMQSGGRGRWLHEHVRAAAAECVGGKPRNS
jgi:hypothetical protein